MAGDASLELQAAIYARLANHAPLMALVAGIYDHVPEGSRFPYVTIGDETATDWSTTSLRGQNSTVTIHTWSVPAEEQGRRECKEVMDAIYEALHQCQLDLENHTLVLMRFDFSETMPDADGVTYHGIQRFRAFTHEGG